MEKIIFIGAGGHCKSVLDSALRQARYEVDGIVDLPEFLGTEICGIKVKYVDEQLDIIYQNGIKNAFITVGGIGDFKLRERLYTKCKLIGFNFPVITDPSAVVSDFAQISSGVYIGKNCVVNAYAQIDEMVIINTASIIEHDCKIKKFSSIAPSSTLSGGVVVLEYTHIGTNSTIRENVVIGEHSIIGAGSVVISDIKGHKKAFGNPCKEVGEW